jgi:CDP-diacylglycerol--serine O-phosphatidyltransferase
LEVTDKRYFQGLPSPAAAALVAGFVWVMIDKGIAGAEVRWLACTLVIFAGITMVTNVRFYSFKDVNLRRSVPFIFIVGIALAFAVVSYDTPVALFGLFVVYALSGYVLALIRIARRKSVPNVS